MGVSNCYFVAPSETIESLDEDSLQSGAIDSIDFRGVGDLELAELFGVLCGTSSDAAQESATLVKMFSDEGPWLFVVDEALTQALATLDESRVSNVASAWIVTEQLAATSWTHEGACNALTNLRMLSLTAASRRLPVHLWVSL